MWYRVTTESVLFDIVLSVLRSAYLSFPEQGCLASSKVLSIFYYYLHSLIFHYVPCYQQITLTCVINKTVLFHMEVFISTFKSIYLKYLQWGPRFEPSISNNMWPHVFRSEFWSHFPDFLVAYSAYNFFLLVYGNFTLTLKMWMCWNPL